MSSQPVISQNARSEAARSQAALSGAAPAQAGSGTPPQPVLSRLISDRLDIPHTISCIRVVGTRPSVGVTRLVAYLSQLLADRHPPPRIIDGGCINLSCLAENLGLPSGIAQHNAQRAEAVKDKENQPEHAAEPVSEMLIIMAHESTVLAEKNLIIKSVDAAYLGSQRQLPHIIFRKRGNGDEADMFGRAPSQLTQKVLYEIAQQIFPANSPEAEQAKQLFCTPLQTLAFQAESQQTDGDQREVHLPDPPAEKDKIRHDPDSYSYD